MKTHKLNTNSNNNNDILIPENLVLHLSKVKLTSDQISVLSKGLSFSPTPGEPDMAQLFLDFERFFRILRLELFWGKQ